MDQVVGVVEVELPVAGVVLPEAAACEFDRPVGGSIDEVVDRCRRRTEEGTEVGAVLGEAREHEATVDGRARDGGKPGATPHRVVRFGVSIGARYAQKTAVGAVGPTVIGADEPAHPTARRLARHHAAVGAAIVQHADRAVVVADGDQRRVSDERSNVIPWFSQLAFMGDEDPHAGEDTLHLKREDFGVRVEAPMHPVGPHQGLD